MMNILYEPFPEEIQADGVAYPILTDFREWFRFADLTADREIPAAMKIYLMMEWIEPPPEIPAVSVIKALFAFYRADALQTSAPDEEENETDEAAQSPAPKPPVFDWRIDAPYLLGDFRHYYGVDLLHVDYLHWWEFRSLFTGLPDESTCRKRIQIRSTDLSKIKNKSEAKRIAQMQRQIALPFAYDDETLGDTLWNMM